jgi:hypothetical protein
MDRKRPGASRPPSKKPHSCEPFSQILVYALAPGGDSDEADRHSDLIAITVPGWIRSVVGAKRRWRMDFPESDRDRQACCC